jgi:hypothetical protein
MVLPKAWLYGDFSLVRFDIENNASQKLVPAKHLFPSSKI